MVKICWALRWSSNGRKQKEEEIDSVDEIAFRQDAAQVDARLSVMSAARLVISLGNVEPDAALDEIESETDRAVVAEAVAEAEDAIEVVIDHAVEAVTEAVEDIEEDRREQRAEAEPEV